MSEEAERGRVDRIVGRLRDIPKRNLLIGDLVHEAADEIERLRAESERLRDELAICCELKRLYSDRLAEALTTPNAAVTRRADGDSV